jgi:hypothetical protein
MILLTRKAHLSEKFCGIMSQIANKTKTGWNKHNQAKGNNWTGFIFPFMAELYPWEYTHLLRTLLLPSVLWGFPGIPPLVHLRSTT